MNTQKAYLSDLTYIRQWGCISFENFGFPVTQDVVLLFITDHLQGMSEIKEKQLMSPLIKNGYKAKAGLHSFSTVKRRLFALTLYHREHGYEDPCASSEVKQQLQVMTKTVKKTTSQKAITEDVLERLLATCNDSAKGIRDRAILLLTWYSGGLQRSKVIAAQVEHITDIGNGLLLHLPTHNSKTDHGINVLIKDKVAQALLNWMVVAEVKQGAIFRAVGKNGKVSDNSLSPIDVNRIVKYRCTVADLDAKQFSAHSLRSGYLMERELSLIKIMGGPKI